MPARPVVVGDEAHVEELERPAAPVASIHLVEEPVRLHFSERLLPFERKTRRGIETRLGSLDDLVDDAGPREPRDDRGPHRGGDDEASWVATADRPGRGDQDRGVEETVVDENDGVAFHAAKTVSRVS